MSSEFEDYTTYIKTQDSVYLQFHTSNEAQNNLAICSEGFGTGGCHLVPTLPSDGSLFRLAWQVEFVVDTVCSVHSLDQKEGKVKTKRAVLYGNAIKLKHSHSDKFLSCRGFPLNSDKLSYQIHLQQEDDACCWFVIVPGQVTRSEGEKVRAGDDVLLKNFSFDRYLCADIDTSRDVVSPFQAPDFPNLPQMTQSSTVIASFNKTLWALQLFTSIAAREQDVGFLCGQESVQFYCRHTSSYFMVGCTEEEGGHCTDEVLKFELTNNKNEVQSIWRIELLQLKWGGFHLQWGQPFRLRHIVSGKFLGSRMDTDKKKNFIVLLSEETALFNNSIFCLRKNVDDTSVWGQKDDQLFKAQIKMGDPLVLLQHLPDFKSSRGYVTTTASSPHLLWVGFATGTVEDQKKSRPAMFLSEGINSKYGLNITATSSEKRKGATNIYITDRRISNFRTKVKETKYDRQFHLICERLIEILEEFSPKVDNLITHEGLFESFLPLSFDVDEIYRNYSGSGIPKLSFGRISRGSTSMSPRIEKIKCSLLDTLSVFLKHNPECCKHFAKNQNLQLFISMLEDPKYNRQVLTVLLRAFQENSEILNNFQKRDILRIIQLFRCFGRNEKILELLTCLCVCNGTAIRRNQNVICNNLLKTPLTENLLLRTINVTKIHIVRANLCISKLPSSATYTKWYYEVEAELFLHTRHFRVGWIALDYFSNLPSYDSSRCANSNSSHFEFEDYTNQQALCEGGIGDDLSSYGFDGQYVWTGGIPFLCPNLSQQDEASSKHVIGCYIDLTDEMNICCWFSLDGKELEPRIFGVSSSEMICPAISFASDSRCTFRFGDNLGEFTYPPDPKFMGLASTRSPANSKNEFDSDLFSLASALRNIPMTNEDDNSHVNVFKIEGPTAIDENSSFVPNPIDVSDIKLPRSYSLIMEHIAEYLHDVWAVNKIDYGWGHGAERNNEKKLHPDLIPYSLMTEAQKRFDIELAEKTIKTLRALGYDLRPPSKEGFKAKKKPLDPNKYKLSNGYLPALYNLDALKELPALNDMIDRLAENAHHIWAKSKVSDGYSYGDNDKNKTLKVTLSLVPYEKLSEADKKSNRGMVKGIIEALIARGHFIISMRSDHEILELARNVDLSNIQTITYRTQSSYGVSEGLWYYDVTLETAEFMRIGWATSEFKAGHLLGSDELSYAYDGYLARKWNKLSITFGQRWKKGDKIRCFLNLRAGTISFACNGVLLRDTENSTIAFSFQVNKGVKYFPAVSLGRGQSVEISFTKGDDVRSYDLLDVYYPFSTDVHTSIPLWYSLQDMHYEPISSPQSIFTTVHNDEQFAINEICIQMKTVPSDPQIECIRMNLGVRVEAQTEDIVPIVNPTANLTENKKNLICFGVRIQNADISKAYLGWTTSSYKFYPLLFSDQKMKTGGQQCIINGGTPSCIRTTYLRPISELIDSTYQDDHLEIYTVLDLVGRKITYHLAFDSECEGKSLSLTDSSVKLFPTVVIAPSKVQVLDFLLDRLPGRTSLAEAILSTDSPSPRRQRGRAPQDSLAYWFPWMELQVASNYSWTYKENNSIDYRIEKSPDKSCMFIYDESKYSSRQGFIEKLVPSGQSKLVKMHTITSSFESTDTIEDKSHCLYVLVPEEETLFRFTDISERPVLSRFLTHSFRLFNAICSHVFSAAIETVQRHITKDTLLAMMYLSLKFYLPNDLKISIYDLYITLNFEKESICCLQTRNDFVFESDFPEDPIPLKSSSLLPPRPPLSAQCSMYSDIGEDMSADLQDAKFKQFIFSKLNEVLLYKEYACRSISKDDRVGLFVPILRIIKHLLLTNHLIDEDLIKLIYLLDSSKSSVNIGIHIHSNRDSTAISGEAVGLLNIENLEEQVKYEICIILDYICDRQLREKIKDLVLFSGDMAYDLGREQEGKHGEVEKQLKNNPSFAMQKTKQFRLKPLPQVQELLGISGEMKIGSESDEDNPLQQKVQSYHNELLLSFDIEIDQKKENLRSYLKKHPSKEGRHFQLQALNSIIKDTLRDWVNTKVAEPRLVCAIFNLLHRQFHEQEEFSNALKNTYILPSSKNSPSYINPSEILRALGHLRSLMLVRIDKSEKDSLKRYLDILSNARLVFHHPELLCSLRIHETVLNLMKHLLDDIQSKEPSSKLLHSQTSTNFNIFHDTISECCKYLCNIARFSGRTGNSKQAHAHSQHMLFPHLDYLLELSGVHNSLTIKHRETDTSPMEVANAVIRNNEHLALSLQEEQIRKVIELLAVAVSDIEHLNSTEQYLEFLKLAVWASDCYIKENAKIIVTHLISNRECLGPALKSSQTIGFSNYFMSGEPQNDDDITPEDSLQYYISLLELLAKCASNSTDEKEGTSNRKEDVGPIRSVLQKIISEDDLRRLLRHSLEPLNESDGELVEIRNKRHVEEWSNFKGSILLFYEQVYSILPQTIITLEESIIADMLYTLCICKVDIDDTAITLIKYTTQFVLPFLQRAIAKMPRDVMSDALSAKLLHASYWLVCLPVPQLQRTINAKNSISDYIQLLAKTLTPSTMFPLLSKVILDLHSLPLPNRVIIFQMLRAHFREYQGYYSGANFDPVNGATPQEQRQLLELAHFLLEHAYSRSPKSFTKIARNNSLAALVDSLASRLNECLCAVIHALAPDMLVSSESDSTHFVLLPNNRLELLDSSIGPHSQILSSFNHPQPNLLTAPETKTPPPDLINKLLNVHASDWIRMLQSRLYSLDLSDLPGLISDVELLLEKTDSSVYLLLSALIKKGIGFVQVQSAQERIETIFSSKDFLSVVKNVFNIGLTKKELRDKTWKRLMRSISLVVLEFSALLNNHIHFRSIEIKNERLSIPFHLLHTREQDIIVEGLYEFFNLIASCGYKLQTTKESSMSVEDSGDNFERKTVTLLVVNELYTEMKLQPERAKSPEAIAFLHRIVLPLITNYFGVHRNYFVSDSNQLVYMSMASPFELVEVAKLFHFVILHLHKNPSLFSSAEDRNREISVALEKLCRCLDPFASNISVDNDVSDSSQELTELDNSNAMKYIEEVISIIQSSLEEISHKLRNVMLSAILPVINVLIKHIGNIRQKINDKPTDNSQMQLDERMTDLFRSIYTLIQSPNSPANLATCGECLTTVCSTRIYPLLEEPLGQVDPLYFSIRDRVRSLHSLEVGSSEYREYVCVYLPLLTRYIKKCNEMQTSDLRSHFNIIPPNHNADIESVISSVVRYFTIHLSADIPDQYIIVQSLEFIIPYTPLSTLWEVIRPFLHSIRLRLVTLWKDEQQLTIDEASKGYNEAEHSELENSFNTILPHLLAVLMLLGKFLHSRDLSEFRDLQPNQQQDHLSLFWDLDFLFNCWQTSQYARQGLQAIIHGSFLSLDYSMEVNFSSERSELSIIILLVLQTQKRVHNERSHILVYCMKAYLDLILELPQFSQHSDVLEYCEKMFSENQNMEYISQKVDQKFAGDQNQSSQPRYRIPTLIHSYHVPQNESQNTQKLDLMEVSRVKALIYKIEHPRAGRGRWKKVLTLHKKRAIMKGFLIVPLYKLPWFRISNYFLESYRGTWLNQKYQRGDIITQLNSNDVAGCESPAPIRLLIDVFCQCDLSHTNQQELYMKYANSLTESCTRILPDDETKDQSEPVDDVFTQQSKKKKLEKQQITLINSNVARMVIVVLAGAHGERGDLVQETLQLGIALLKGGNYEVQKNILEFLQTSCKVGGDFFTSMAKLIADCAVLDRSTYERQCKVYGSSMDNLPAAIKDEEFTQNLFRFLQLLCEGHNMNMQNYLRSQPDKPSNVNLIVFSVDYLLSLQESIQNFYGQYAGLERIDQQGQSNFTKVFKVVRQVFNTLTEYIQGPCYGNQLALTQSRLWDAMSGFFYIFAKLQKKLSSEYEYSIELLKDVLDVHADMIILLLSMLEGNVSIEAHSISGQMKDALIESRQNLLEIVEFCCTFIELNDLITSKAFQSYDINKDGVVSRIEFENALSTQPNKYKPKDIDYLMRCADSNQDGVIDYMEFMERFYNPCGKIGFNLSVLFTILFDHLFEGDANTELTDLRKGTETLMGYFRPYTGCIEIIGKSKKVEKVFFQIDKTNLEQWDKSQIQESKHNFVRNLDHEIFTKEKMDRFMDFCEDSIFEMKHAAMLSQSVQKEREKRAYEHHEKSREFFKQMPTDPVDKLAVNYRARAGVNMSRLERASRCFRSFYSKLGLLRFVLIIPILLEFCINIITVTSQLATKLKRHSGTSKPSEDLITKFYVPKIIRATTRFSSNVAQMDYLLRKSSMVIVFVLNLLLMLCNLDGLSGFHNATSTSSIELLNIQIPQSFNLMKVILLYSISLLHFFLSMLLIWTYWKLKFPLIIFRKEKYLCHEIETNKDKLKEEFSTSWRFINKRWWDSIVIESATFPQLYWNKLVRQEMNDEYNQKDTKGIDLNYNLWIVARVMLTDFTFLLKIIYFMFSALGVFYSPAFFCIHLLLDVYTNFETLRTIFQSIYHNRTRLFMSVFILLVVQLIFAIIGMYLFKPHQDNLSDIFLFLLGQIPGGTLNLSERFPPEHFEISPKDTTITVYSIAYFFAIQLVLVALIQGLIIDAFGELRNKQEAAREAMQNKCFICGLNKETFDQHIPRGFEMHTEKEHHYPNYLFFLMHLIHKEETEYTGQESYVMDMYRSRNWEFFPVGVCFSQQQLTDSKQT
ncbi:Ryanodine receptor 3 [Oopsacas minuta]|uniref:Ryanodine receptor 3 n=1 Tax=Oopsacas minuta TaxID=111878 RepID=A0AAV7JZ53_9METZ|nr:Ryanodine receptor 3 [Oopsacas minuta]